MAVIDTQEGITYVTLLALRGGLKLEILGMQRRGASAYSMVKRRFGFKGNKQKVYDQLEAYIAAYKKQLQLNLDAQDNVISERVSSSS